MPPSNKKSRNGCTTCKARRLKCDEARPSCTRCVRRGVPCPGYGQPLRWSTKHEVLGIDVPGWQDGRGRHHSNNNNSNNNNKSKRDHQQKQSARTDNRASQSPLDGAESGPREEVGETHSPDDHDHLLQWDWSTTWPSLPEKPDSIYWPIGQSPPSDTYRHDISTADGFQMTTPDEGEGDGEEEEIEDWLGSFQPEGEPSFTDQLSIQDPDLSRQQTELNLAVPPSTPRQVLPSVPTIQSDIQRMEPGPQSMLPLLKSVNDDSSILVEFYFKDTAQLFSCYDGRLNPFRTMVSQLWVSSPVIYHCLTSMAAGSLVDNFPRFNAIGQRHRQDAMCLLEQQTEVDETMLLALLMLGGTASWHNPKDMGVAFFNRLQSHLERMATTNGQDHRLGNNFRFFQESMLYWEMLLAYVIDSKDLNESGGCGLPIQEHSSTRRVPHPWTGIARETQILVQRVGRLVRRQRMRARSPRFATQAQIARLQQALAEAQTLEERLLAVGQPLEERDIVNPEDRQTPLWHLIDLAEVYRCAGLLQLYRVFPDLLCSRIVFQEDAVHLDHEGTQSSAAYSGTAVDQTRIASLVSNRWLTAFAVKTLNVLRLIPLESGTKDFQPFLLVACSSELRIVPDRGDPSSASPSDGDGLSTRRMSDVSPLGVRVDASPLSIEVLRAREMIITRLTAFLHILPPRPIRVCLEIVKAGWRKMDEVALMVAKRNLSESEHDEALAAVEYGYWLDVMIENGWETTMA